MQHIFFPKCEEAYCTFSSSGQGQGHCWNFCKMGQNDLWKSELIRRMKSLLGLASHSSKCDGYKHSYFLMPVLYLAPQPHCGNCVEPSSFEVVMDVNLPALYFFYGIREISISIFVTWDRWRLCVLGLLNPQLFNFDASPISTIQLHLTA